MLSPLSLLGPPLLVFISIPLAIFAVITTSLAVTTLAIRVSIVYFELGVALIHSALFPPPQKSPPARSSPRRTSPHRTRTRRSSVASTTSSQDTAIPLSRLKNKSGSFVSLIGTSEPTRDFEGVGGWRLAANDDEEALWMGMNSRLELPAALPKRNHRRSLTGGSQRHSWDPEAMRMSPMQSRSRTPPKTTTDERYGDTSYFPPQPSMKPLSSSSDPSRMMQDARRRSLGGSSSSSLASRTSLAMKQAGE